MKKYGKYEKRPSAKNEQLRTYLTSLLSLALCVTMFLGTSLAWFTSEVNNTENEIYIGTLDVGFFRVNKANNEMENMADSTYKFFDSNIRWEPGYTALETIRVVNEGDLAFKYVLDFTEGALDEKEGDAQTLQDVAKFFDIWVYPHANVAEVPEPQAYTDITDSNSGWIHAGSLEEVLADKVVLTGIMNDVRYEPTPVATVDDSGEATAEVTEPAKNDAGGKPAVQAYTIALHMNEEANDSVMGRKIGLTVKLVAYQMSYEEDDLNGVFDCMVATPEELREALKNGGNVALAADIAMNGVQVEVPADVTVILDLNGHKITDTVATPVSMITNNGNLTINGEGAIEIKFEGEKNNNTAVNAIANRGVLVVNGGTISNTSTTDGQIGYAIDNYNGATLTVNGGNIVHDGSGSYDSIRLFCGSNETLVVVNGGEIETIWAQNPTASKATKVNGTVIVNGGTIDTVFYENHTTVQVKDGVDFVPTPYGEGKDDVTFTVEGGYTVYEFDHSGN